jgi:hypothetical protein
VSSPSHTTEPRAGLSGIVEGGPIRRGRAALAVVALACAAASPAHAQSPSPISAFGKGFLETLSPTDGEALSLEIQMRNATGGPVRVARA